MRGSTQQLTETEGDSHSQTRQRSWDPLGKVGGKIEGFEGDRIPTGRQTMSTLMDSWESLETEPPTKDHKQAEGCLVFPQWERTHLILQRLIAPGWGMSHPLRDKEKRRWGREIQ